jgi:glycosyltransferase involved in cell wall biosynthesis
VFRPTRVIAVNDEGGIYNYGRKVRFTIDQESIEDYVQAVRYVDQSKIDLVNLQHEYGLFGGSWGGHILSFLKCKKPIVTTFHTVLQDFESDAKKVLENIVEGSASIVTTTNSARDLLIKFDVEPEKISVIPHGCPNVSLVDSEKIKRSLRLKDRIVLSTFGLINRGKGIQHAIRALPPLVEKEPRILYLIIGATHPEVRKFEGERYRKMLSRLIGKLKLKKHVRFYNRFLSKRELIRFLQATDIYITPYVDRNQVSSGSLTYALGTGKAVISTPYLHAKEALAEGRGLLCRFRSPASIAECIKQLLENVKLRHDLERKTYAYSRDFTWPKVGERYAELFNHLLDK